jgi:hypothetical protein
VRDERWKAETLGTSGPEAGHAIGFAEGYKILYAPWATSGKTDAVFLSFNPGRPPVGPALVTLGAERGSSHKVERHFTASPITAQFLALAGLLRLRPIELLTGVVVPFRSDRWGQVPAAKRNAALDLGRKFSGHFTDPVCVWRRMGSVQQQARALGC